MFLSFDFDFLQVFSSRFFPPIQAEICQLTIAFRPALFLSITLHRTAANLSPSDPEIQYNLGAVLEALEQLEEALKAYKEAKEGGIERADQNIRNCQAKIMAAKVHSQSQGQSSSWRTSI